MYSLISVKFLKRRLICGKNILKGIVIAIIFVMIGLVGVITFFDRKLNYKKAQNEDILVSQCQ